MGIMNYEPVQRRTRCAPALSIRGRMDRILSLHRLSTELIAAKSSIIERHKATPHALG